MDNNKDLIKSTPPKSELIKYAEVKSLQRFEKDIETAIAEIEAKPLQRIKGPLIGMEFVLIPGGSFMMGSNDFEDFDNHEKPVHRVNIKSFYMMTTMVTQEMWVVVMGVAVLENNPSSFKGDNLPVDCLSWDDCQKFIRTLNQWDPGKGYRLPTEAEWEYVCRAGTTTKYYSGDNESDLDDIAWYHGNSTYVTHPVGQKKPNRWGLYDMHGNGWEWCEDWFHDNYEGAPTDGSAWLTPTSNCRVLRGGNWLDDYLYCECRSAVRDWAEPYNRSYYWGFRLVRNL